MALVSHRKSANTIRGLTCQVSVVSSHQLKIKKSFVFLILKQLVESKNEKRSNK